MWSSNEEMRERKMIALADRGYLQQEEEHKNGRKFSRAAAMILGSLLTLEIMVAGAMIFNIDVHAVDGIAPCTVVYGIIFWSSSSIDG